MENNKKIRIKVNAFDVFLILLALCLVATFALKIYTGIAENKNRYNNEYILTFSCVDEYDSILAAVKDGDALYLEDGEILGYIAMADKNSMSPFVITSSSKSDLICDPSSWVDFTVPGTTKLDLISFTGIVKLNGNAKRIENGDYFVLGDDKISEGLTLTVHTLKAEFKVTVVSIDKIDRY